MKAKTTRQLASLFYKANEASHRATFNEQPINLHPVDRIARMPFATS